MDFARYMWLSCNNGPSANCPEFDMTSISISDREAGTQFLPRFDAQGLLTAIAVDSLSRDVLMVAFMDAEALAKIFAEIDRLEKTKLNVRRNTLIDELYQWPLTAAAVCALLAVVLGQTLLRRNP